MKKSLALFLSGCVMSPILSVGPDIRSNVVMDRLAVETLLQAPKQYYEVGYLMYCLENSQPFVGHEIKGKSRSVHFSWNPKNSVCATLHTHPYQLHKLKGIIDKHSVQDRVLVEKGGIPAYMRDETGNIRVMERISNELKIRTILGKRLISENK